MCPGFLPVESDVEFSFVECVHQAWMASGDDAWLRRRVDHALRALRFSLTDRVRWSTKHRLVRRGFTIDTWDFQPEQDQIATDFCPQGDSMWVDPERTRFGIFHGDNTGTWHACLLLEEMLAYLGRSDEAAEVRAIGEGIKQRLDAVSWNGDFYTHHVPEDPDVERDFGDLDQSQQVSQSNAFALCRRLPHEQAVAIIDTYRRIRAEMPDTSTGEWYAIYPPFPEGFTHEPWEYVNGGGSLIACGDLATGAFEHGREDYGVDILRRLEAMGSADRDYLHTNMRGCMPELPERRFQTVDLDGVANAHLRGDDDRFPDVQPWTGEGDNDLRALPIGEQTFSDVPFAVRDPEAHAGRVAIALGARQGFARRARLPVTGSVRALYLLHTAAGMQPVGNLIWSYADGGEAVTQVDERFVGNWWFPNAGNRNRRAVVKTVAWTGANPHCDRVGVYASGLINPHPERELAAVELEATRNGSAWMVLAATASPDPVFFMPTPRSAGMINIEGPATITRALIQGLAGAVHTGPAFAKARLCPRWAAAAVDEVAITAKLEPSGGYLSYRYRAHAGGIDLLVTGSAATIDAEVLLPTGRAVAEVRVDGEALRWSERSIEDSRYLCFRLEGVGTAAVEIVTRSDL